MHCNGIHRLGLQSTPQLVNIKKREYTDRSFFFPLFLFLARQRYHLEGTRSDQGQLQIPALFQSWDAISDAGQAHWLGAAQWRKRALKATASSQPGSISCFSTSSQLSSHPQAQGPVLPDCDDVTDRTGPAALTNLLLAAGTAPSPASQVRDVSRVDMGSRLATLLEIPHSAACTLFNSEVNHGSQKHTPR